MFPDDKKIERMLAVAHMYYEDGLTQNQIAEDLGISRPLVSQLLTDARSCGLVSITINDIHTHEQLLARRLEERFGLRSALVVPESEDIDSTDNTTAWAALELCFQRRAGKIGIGWGPMISRMADWPGMARSSPGSRLVPLVGAMPAAQRGYHTNELVRMISAKLGCSTGYLYFPAFFPSVKELELAKSMESFKAMCREWDELDLVYLELSDLPETPDPGALHRYGKGLRERAVGRVLVHYYDAEGQLLLPEVEDAVSCSIDQLRSASEVVGVCSASLREESLLGAIRLGLVQQLVLPASLAKKMLALPEKA